MNTKTGRKTVITALLIASVVAVVEVYYYFSHRTIIFADGKRFVVITRDKNPFVKDVLEAGGIAYAPQDIIEPDIAGRVGYPRIVRVFRVTEEIEVSTSPPVVSVVEKVKSSANLRPVFYKKIKITSEIIKTRVVRKDGVESLREVVEKKISERFEEYLYLLDARGKKSVLTYRLNDYPKKKMIATAYYPGDPLAWRDGTETYLGMKMQRGIVAVDPRVIPLRTRLWIPGYGYGYAADTGSAIKGNRIDLGVNNAEEEKPWMHRKVVVYVLGRAKSY